MPKPSAGPLALLEAPAPSAAVAPPEAPKSSGGRPAKSGARRELKTFRLVPDALAHLERVAVERGVSTSDVLNDWLLGPRGLGADAPPAPRRLELVPAPEAKDGLVPFRVLRGGGPSTLPPSRHSHALERLRDGLGGVLEELEALMAEQATEGTAEAEAAKKAGGKRGPADAAYATGFRDGMLEALETAYALLQTELLITQD